MPPKKRISQAAAKSPPKAKANATAKTTGKKEAASGKSVKKTSKNAAPVKTEKKALKRSASNTSLSTNGSAPKKSAAAKTTANQKTPKKSIIKSSKYVGAHVSIAGGLENAVFSAVELGAKAFGMFLRSQRQWNCKPLTQEAANKFRQACKDHNFAPHQILPHGSYLLNCGAPNKETLEKSRTALIDELKRCEMLGLVYYNFHPGSTCGEIDVEKCLDLIAESINLAHRETKYAITVVENMSKQGYTIGGDFKELKGIINRVKDKSRIGVCLDTCHAYAAGYDIATEEGYNQMMQDFESIVGLKYLKAVHLNDSQGKVGCHLDRHENIGKGHIGLAGFRYIMNDSRLDYVPMILETPGGVDYAKEIKLLYSMCT